MATKDLIALNVDEIDEQVIEQAGLKAGDAVVAEPTNGGILLRRATPEEIDARDTSASAIHRRLGTRPLTAEEFNEQFGHLPTDGEG